MAEEKAQYLDKEGLKTLVKEIEKRQSGLYSIRGSAVYADESYLEEPEHEEINSVGLWQNVSGDWTKITEVKPGWVFNITNDFTTDGDFIEGEGVSVSAGSNIVAVNTATSDAPDMKWDVLSGSVGTDMEPISEEEILEMFE